MNELADRQHLQEYLRLYGLEPVFPAQLLPYLSLCHFKQGELICTQGEVSESLYVLVRGKVKVYTTSPEGRTLILSFKRPPEVIGDVEYIRQADTLNTVEAVSAVTVIGVQYRWLRRYGSEHVPLLHFLLDGITRKFAAKSNSLSFNLLYPVEVRFASYLLCVSLDESGQVFTQRLSTESLTDAANLIGTSYRHLNRVIRQFCDDGLIERAKGAIIVKDRDGLRRLGSQNIYE